MKSCSHWKCSISCCYSESAKSLSVSGASRLAICSLIAKTTSMFVWEKPQGGGPSSNAGGGGFLDPVE